MKRLWLKTLAAALLATVFFLGAQLLSTSGKMTHIVSILWFNFEEDNQFDIVGSKFLNEEKTATKTYEQVPEGLGDSRSESTRSLGIRTAFNRKGYNWLDIIPRDGAEGPENQGNFPGLVRSMDLWVWGGSFLYNMELVLQDYKGYEHNLPMGNLDYFGWANKNTAISPTIPQDEPYAPRRKGLIFRKFRVYSTPEERVDRFHIFIDYFKIVTDAYRDQYDGYELEKIIAQEEGDDNPIYQNGGSAE